MKIKGNPKNKYQLIRRLTELTKEAASYTGPPEFSYDVGHYRILRDGSLIVLEEFIQPQILRALIHEKLIEDPSVSSLDAADPPPSNPNYTISSSKSSDNTARASSPDLSSASFPRQRFDQPICIRESMIEIRVMINLINMIGSKGPLLSKAAGSPNAFWVSENVLFDLNCEKPSNLYELHRILRISDRAGLLKGMELEANAITFTGCPRTDDYVVYTAWEKLARGMYDHASAMKFVSRRRPSVIESEKYYFRNWLYHLGLGGPENRTIRTILMRNLSGNGSYRTQEQLLAHEIRRQKERRKRHESDTGQE